MYVCVCVWVCVCVCVCVRARARARAYVCRARTLARVCCDEEIRVTRLSEQSASCWTSVHTALHVALS